MASGNFGSGNRQQVIQRNGSREQISVALLKSRNVGIKAMLIQPVSGVSYAAYL